MEVSEDCARDRSGPRPVTAPAVDLIIKGGQVVTSTDVFDAAGAITDGRIAALGPERRLLRVVGAA